ncbi:putative Proteasome subunit alpha type-5 [Blattamonas nauphoetae]|uniref:Proteasome subunit alpha type n=1 Tax=Blattamonas nauphoetae TaxID=2049346 RepID=A0ABQ9XWY4_9EUKA|nr:putative Proteasome subunit alpha type-5 [Blattamonas nauphoetae]
MYQNKSDYDRGVNTFSPEGRIFQVEYAMEAVNLGTTAIGIQVEEGTLLAVEKKITSSLLEPQSVDKIMKIDHHIACALAGLQSDGKTLVDKARQFANQHTFNYDEPMSVEACAQAVCDESLKFGEGKKKNKMSRPYGVALLLAGVDEIIKPGDKPGEFSVTRVPRLYHTDPSGTYIRTDYKAIGAGAEGAQSMLEEEWHKGMTIKQCEELCITVLRQVMENTVKETNVEMAVLSAGPGAIFHPYTTEEIKGIIERTPEQKL